MENTYISTWFNDWSLNDKEYTATELYNDYKSKTTGFCISLIHFSKQLATLARQGKMLTRSKNGKTLYYKEPSKTDVPDDIKLSAANKLFAFFQKKSDVL